ncbi:hypothetical protein [Chlorogloeopsis sp. ULAP02]
MHATSRLLIGITNLPMLLGEIQLIRHLVKYCFEANAERLSASAQLHDV